ncbi:TPA: helix-turn-helix domain-containing protein [Vibrio parahaemolyticus]
MPEQNTPKLLISSSTNLRPFLEYFEWKKINWITVAQQCGLPEDILDSECWLPSQHLMNFIQKMVTLYGPSIVVEAGNQVSLSQLLPELDEALNTYLTLEEGVHVLMEKMPSLSNHVIIWPEKINDNWMLCHRSAYRPSTLYYEQTEWFRTYALVAFCRRFLGIHWQPDLTWMSCSEHLAKGWAPTYYHNNIKYQQPFGAISLPVSEDFIPMKQTERTQCWIETISALAQTYAALPCFNVDWFANLTGTTSRTMQRRLQQHDTSFRELRDNARANKARLLLLHTDLAVQDIAWRCGYNDLANFNRAFKSWMSMTAPQYRRQNVVKTSIQHPSGS